MSNVIDTIYEEYYLLTEFLEKNNEISFNNTVSDNFKKTLLLSIASFFESKITDMIFNYTVNKTENDTLLTSFVRSKAINRQYHTYFDWKCNNINQFLGCFGQVFKEKASRQIKENLLEDNVKAFMEIGSYRNQMVHQNFASFYLDKTTEEVYELYKKAIVLVAFLEELFTMQNTVA